MDAGSVMCCKSSQRNLQANAEGYMYNLLAGSYISSQC